MRVGIPFVQNCIFYFALVIIWICNCKTLVKRSEETYEQ